MTSKFTTVAAKAGLTGAVALAAVGASLGAGAAGAEPAHGGGFPGGPTCPGDRYVKAESEYSQVVICQIPDHSIDYMYQGKAKSTGDMTTLMTARYASGGYHVSNNGYTYHVRPDALEIDGPDGSVVSYEPWTFYESTE